MYHAYISYANLVVRSNYIYIYMSLLLSLGDESKTTSKLDLCADKVGKVSDGKSVLETLLDASLVVGAASRPATNTLKKVSANLGVALLCAAVDALDVCKSGVDEGRKLAERRGEGRDGRKRWRSSVGGQEVDWD